MNEDKGNRAIVKGVNFLAKEQEKDGSFMCLVSTKLDDYKSAKIVPAIVPTNIVLSSLARAQARTVLAYLVPERVA